MQRPLYHEYNPYFQKYIDLVGDGDFFGIFRQNVIYAVQFFEFIPVSKHNYRYAPGKWNIKEVLMHIIDKERVMAYRALVAGRGDGAAILPAMEENLYARNVDVSERTMDSLLKELTTVRANSTMLLENLSEEQTRWAANVNGHPITPRALGYIITGHLLHHIQVIEERYL